MLKALIGPMISRSENLTVRRKLVACVVAGMMLGGLVIGGVFARWRAAAPSGPPTAEPRSASELAPDPAVVHYRHPIPANVDDRADMASTIAALEARVKAFDKSPFDYEELAQQYLRRAQIDGDKADFAAAEAAARHSLDIIRNPNPALVTLGKVLGARHEFREAITLAEEQLAHKKTAGAYNLIATSRLALGELAEAGEAANAALAMKPDSGGYLMRALVMQAQGRDAEAAFDFAHAARTEEYGDVQASAHLRSLWGRFLLRRGDPAGAKVCLDEALRIAPELPLALAQRGELALRTGHAKDASALFEQAFVASRQVRYLMDQARAQELAGDRAGANGLRDQVETIVRGELEEGGFGHRLDLVEVLVDRGDKLAAAVTLGRAEIAHRPSAEARFQLARALFRTGDQDGAGEQVQAALATGAREAQLYELASRIEAARGNAPRAALYERAADQLDPANSGWRSLGLGGLGGP